MGIAPLRSDTLKVTHDRRQQDRVIRRPRLLRLLDDSPSRIVTLIAPAGYGKTTLAQQWLNEVDASVSWFRATSTSRDVASTASKVAAAIADLLPGSGGAMRDRLRVSRSPSDEAEVLAELLAADVHDWPAQSWLVIDDYQLLIGESAAEMFIETFLFSARTNALVLSRKRPSWSTSRRLLYGEVYEVGRSLLAMDSEEAAAVLSQASSKSLPGLHALAEGWPAVIALAAVRPIEHLPESQVPEQIFEFLTEEIHNSLTLSAQTALRQLASLPRLDSEVVSTLYGPPGTEVLRELVDAGLATERTPGSFEVHPLIRSFLDRERTVVLPAHEGLDGLVALYLSRGELDEALALAPLTAGPTVERVLGAVLDPLMNQGRLQTLEETIEAVASSGRDSALLDLVQAEVAFRRSEYDRAEALASRAGRLLPSSHNLRSRALFRAGHSAFFADRTQRALEYAESARGCATSQTDIANSLWLHFVGSTELELPEARDVLDQLEGAATDDPYDVVRLATGRLILADRWGETENALTLGDSAYWVADRVSDPMVRSSFFNIFARVLIATGKYEKAMSIVEQGMDDIRRARLDFALPHMLMPKSSAELGLGQVLDALETANQALRLAKDAHTGSNCALHQARAHLVRRDYRAARQSLAQSIASHADPATRGELLAHDALATACQGNATAAAAGASAARSASSTVQAHVVALLALTLAQHEEKSTKTFSEALHLVDSSEHIDYLVMSGRASDAICEKLGASSSESPSVHEAQRLVNRPIVRQGEVTPLTRREKEVLDLVTLGLSNRTIAQKLYISEVTVKVHVRHILSKLGAKSRTEAAVVNARGRAGSTPPG